MESVDRLRTRIYDSTLSSHVREELMHITDAIEAEAAEKVLEAHRRGHDEGFASADDWLAQHEDAMAEHGWVRLPVDADGEVIHLGDVLEIERGGGTDMGEVTDIHLQEGKCAVTIGFEYDSAVTAFPEDYRHRKPDTWERIIEDVEVLGRDWFDRDKGMDTDEHGELIGKMVERCKALAKGEAC